MEERKLKQFTFYDLYASGMHLLDGVNWMKLDCGLEKSDHAGQE